MVFTTRNPYTNQKVQSYQTLSNTEVTTLIEGAHQTYMRFRHLGPESRQEKMLNVRTILLDHKIEYARLITEEMGKPLTQSIAEIEKCALVCEHYAYNAGMYLKDKSIETEDKSINLVYEPSGVILGIMPWNYPFWQVFRVLAPNLMLGNSVVIKHAENTLGCGELIKTIIEQAGFKPHSFTHVVIEEHQTEHIIANPLLGEISSCPMKWRQSYSLWMNRHRDRQSSSTHLQEPVEPFFTLHGGVALREGVPIITLSAATVS